LEAKGRARDQSDKSRMRNDPEAGRCSRLRSRHGSFRAKTVVAHVCNDDVKTGYTWQRLCDVTQPGLATVLGCDILGTGFTGNNNLYSPYNGSNEEKNSFTKS